MNPQGRPQGPSSYLADRAIRGSSHGSSRRELALCQATQKPSELQERVEPFGDPHVAEADLLDELELLRFFHVVVFAHLGLGLGLGLGLVSFFHVVVLAHLEVATD